jgi:nucleotide-binding universal stress UspA family protein
MEQTEKCILVPTDFSEHADHALRYAGTLAMRLGARIVLMYADDLVAPMDFTGTAGGWSDDTTVILQARAEQSLVARATSLVDPSVEVRTVVRAALTEIDGIIDEARESNVFLIVMGTHGRRGVSRLLVGSVTEAVMRGATVPVLAIPPESKGIPEIRTILGPVTYSVQCFDALSFAGDLAPADAQFVIVRAVSTEDLNVAADELEQLKKWIPPNIAGRSEFRIVSSGRLAEQIEEFSRNVHSDLIVAGEKSHRTARDLAFGTLAERILQRSECPVLTVDSRAAGIMDRRAIREAVRDSPRREP